MEPTPIDPIVLMVNIIKDHAPENIWLDSLLQGYRGLGNTNRGEIGEEFVRQYLRAAGIAVSKKGNRSAITDMLIADHRFEVKTASLGANGTFQFNLWRKGDVAEGNAGKLVRMAEGQAVTWKLTKKLSSMLLIEELPDMIRTALGLGRASI